MSKICPECGDELVNMGGGEYYCYECECSHSISELGDLEDFDDLDEEDE